MVLLVPRATPVTIPNAIASAGLSIFVPGHNLATGILRGAARSYSNIACLQPAGAKKWNCLMHSDMPAALDIERRLRHWLNQHILLFCAQGYSDPALDKLLAAIGGWAQIGTRLRWPYRSVEEDEAKRLRPTVRSLVPELFEDVLFLRASDSRRDSVEHGVAHPAIGEGEEA